MRILNCILTFLLFGLISCNSTDEIFTDENYQDTIGQDIGGILIRDIHHYNDFNSFNYDIEYSYKDKNDSISKIGKGSFYGQQPTENEQLIRIGKWFVFKTSGDRDKDFIFISDSNNTWLKYEISSETIQQNGLWKEQNINAQKANWDNVAKVKQIDNNGNVTVMYEFAKNKRIFSFLTGKRKVEYKINLQTGKLSMDNIYEL
ncbi:hypothetical protein Q4534_23590 [Cyclobacterium sp. 1_MG-2023]|uniref:hypothetical protein n=1 Tax=Cyclobacterium sp. 1_MG-2023 TaxID=3062681 RepID=UPI0026E130B4|nr:hypothetical protein [Cyclobacterium sp. 1_MG-2023]MDO6440429.1 hypothetical protein [Cyclobacterium sp. 1_MG-2023]